MAVTESDSKVKLNQQEADNYQPPKKDDNERMLQIRKRFNTMQSGWSHVKERGLKDDYFVGGKQWPATASNCKQLQSVAIL